MTVRDNPALSRFELDVEGGTAFANYRRMPGMVIITHTETPRALRGRGIGSELVGGALELIRADGSKVVALRAAGDGLFVQAKSLRESERTIPGSSRTNGYGSIFA
jgi:predicted GNAT family acetyltransferase